MITNNTKRDQPAVSKIITDDLINIFGQNEQEILNFIGVTNEIEEYELRFTNSAEILNWDYNKEDIFDNTGVVESLEDEQLVIEEKDKERALVQIQTTEAEIAADINKYLKALKSKESLEFEQISREEIFERLKCKCFEWHRIKKKETIKDVIKQICRAKVCKKGVKTKEKEERAAIEERKGVKSQKIKSSTKSLEKDKKCKYGICTGPVKKRAQIRKKVRKYTRKKLAELASIRDKISRDTLRTEIKRFADYVQSTDSKQKDDSDSSDEISTMTSAPSITTHKQLLRAKDSVLLRKEEDTFSSLHQGDRSSTESASSTVSGNIQHLESLEKIGKRKINPKMFNMYLNEFNSIKNFAFVFIDNILQEAELKANVSIIDPLEIDINDYICPEFICGEEDLKPPIIPEKTISLYSEVYGFDLTPHEGKNMVRDIIKYWKIRKTWKYYVNFLGQQTDSCSDYYNYEVKWSEPTFSYPVPQVTASVFFTIQMSRVKPTMFPPKVTFVFESERYKFTSYDDIAHEKFLDEIIYCKTAFFKSMRF